MKLAILILPTLLAAFFVAALSTEVSPPDTPAAVASRAAEVRELHRVLDNASARLTVLEPVLHNFVPRGTPAANYHFQPKGTSCAQSTATVCLLEGRVTKQHAS